MKPRLLLLLFLVVLLSDYRITRSWGLQPDLESSTNYVNIKVVDANTDEPIRNATIILWDSSSPSFWSRLGSTDDRGEYYFDEAVQEHLYQVYAYKGDLTAGCIGYAPQAIDIELSYSEANRNITLRLVPGAAIHLTGEISVVESVNPPSTFVVRIVDPKSPSGSPPTLNGSFIHTYDRTVRSYLREKRSLDDSIVLIPAGIPVELEFSSTLYTPERGSVPISFSISVGPLSKGSQVEHRLEEYSLKGSIETVWEYILSAYEELDNARSVGFYLAEEGRTLDEQQSALRIARDQLSRGDLTGYRQCWATLRTAYKQTSNVLTALHYYILLSGANAVYLPAFLAVYSAILAFFLFEDDRRKLTSGLLLYALLLAVLFNIYPGVRIIMEQNLHLFALAAGLSVAITLGLAFAVGIYWKPSLEGLFRTRDILATLFSIGKRQIKLRRSRGSLTLSSLTILVLAFTALTSFGWVYGITKETIPYSSSVSGVLMRRTGNEFFTYQDANYPLFVPLGTNYCQRFQQSLPVEHIGPKTETYPGERPIAKIISDEGKAIDILGVVGVEPTAETLFTMLNEIVLEGRGSYLDEEDPFGIMIGETASVGLNVEPGDPIELLSSEGVVLTCTVKGIFSDSGYEQLKEIDGQPFGPKCVIERDGEPFLTLCNATNVVIMNWQTTVALQRQINIQQEKEENEMGRFNSLSRVAFTTKQGVEEEGIVNTVVNGFYCDAFISSEGVISRYYTGYYYEAKGTVEIFLPLVMSSLSVGAVMLNAVYERRREMKILAVVGANPAHLAMVFVSEAIILGMVGGGLGYLLGLGFYRIMPLFGSGLMVREKLEWWWSALGLGIAVVASVLSTVRPALLAVKLYTPSRVRRVKVSEEERDERNKQILRVYQARSVMMPVKVDQKDALFFFSFLLGRLQELKTRLHEGILDLEELPDTETPRNELIKRFTFSYASFYMNQKIVTKNQIVCSKSPNDDYYRVQLVSNLDNIEVSEECIYRIAEVIRDITMYWAKNRERIIGIT
ncbi:MAG: FtsX-like permease family protein [Candidatus Bathyarchaeia archaeon]